MLRMTDLSAFPITKRFPPKRPDRLQLYSLTTPNGVKASIALEETELPYEAHYIDFGKDDQKTPEFRALNPYAQDPRHHRPKRPWRQTACRSSSPARSSSTSRRRPAEAASRSDPARRYETIQWLFFPGGRHRPDLRPSSATSTSSRAARSKTSARSNAIATRPSASSKVVDDRLAGRDLDHGRRVHHRRHRHDRPSPQSHRLSTARAIWSSSTRFRKRAGVAGARIGAAGGRSAA
jgi:hypothetical protein